MTFVTEFVFHVSRNLFSAIGSDRRAAWIFDCLSRLIARINHFEPDKQSVRQPKSSLNELSEREIKFEMKIQSLLPYQFRVAVRHAGKLLERRVGAIRKATTIGFRSHSSCASSYCVIDERKRKRENERERIREIQRKWKLYSPSLWFRLFNHD